MITAFSPGHVTCFFQPVSSLDPLSAGSRGAGIRINLGATVTVKSTSEEPVTKIDGKTVEGKIVRGVVRALDPTREYDIDVKHDVPVGQGFGTSAADAVAAALCVCQITGKDIMDGYRTAHTVEIREGGGRGDVSGIMSRYLQPIRTVAGIPPFGRVMDSHIPIGNLTLFTVGPTLETKTILSDRDTISRIRKRGAVAIEDYMKKISLESLFKISNRFSEESGLRTKEIDSAIKVLKDAGHMAAMCMLGNSLFTTASEKTVKELIGDVWTKPCNATSEEAKIIRIR